jgi:hypothetical protein
MHERQPRPAATDRPDLVELLVGARSLVARSKVQHAAEECAKGGYVAWYWSPELAAAASAPAATIGRLGLPIAVPAVAAQRIGSENRRLLRQPIRTSGAPSSSDVNRSVAPPGFAACICRPSQLHRRHHDSGASEVLKGTLFFDPPGPHSARAQHQMFGTRPH